MSYYNILRWRISKLNVITSQNVILSARRLEVEEETRTRRTLELLRTIVGDHAPAVLAASFGAEDMVLIDLIARHGLLIGVFTLDTGRLPEETYSLMHSTARRYRIPVAVFSPETADVERYVAAHGPNAFYDSQALRQQCCFIRKVKPLKRALAGNRAWITGQRREQSVTRRDLPTREWDAEHGLDKFNPLADWSQDEVWAYIRRHAVPYNALHDRGYPSIGCAPCTRAIGPGEDVRAGRWWWESAEHRECGLHPHRRAS
ncbi:MAG: phosphoadenylyl-sulfate reductase [Alphaproteobacteria bacterium]|nr:phosphoadenylyl-sulfate reductase [Alphaproteobacteria bacterium]